MIEVYEKIMKYVDEHINEEITIDDLARDTRYSRRHIYKVFQEYNDMPIMEYIRRRKMHAASAEFLSERTMYDIALDYGYETPAGFYKAFKSVFGCSPSDYKSNMLRGAVMNNHNNNIRSVEEITRDIELDAGNAQLYIERGRSCLRSGQPEKAVEDFGKALELDLKNQAEVYRELGNAYFHLQKHDKVIEYYTMAIELHPGGNIVRDYLMRGCSYKTKGEFAKAIEDFTKIPEFDPTFALAYCHRGVCYFKTGDPDKAAEDFDKAAEVTKEPGYTYYQLGVMHEFELKQYDKAFEYYSKTIELNSNFTGAAYANRGGIYQVMMNEYDKALEDYTKAIELNPKSDSTYINRACVYQILKQYDKAMADCEKAIEINPNAEWANSTRANVLRAMKKYDEAVEFYNKAIELNPNSGTSYVNRGHLYRNMEKYEEAIEDYTKSIELDPKMQWAYMERGIIYKIFGDHEKADADFAKSAEVTTLPVHMYSDLGLRLYNSGMYNDAIKYYGKAIELDPGDKKDVRMAYLRAYLNRGCVYDDLDMDDEALADFSKSVELNIEWKYTGDAWTYWRRAMQYNKMGDYARAVQDCCTALGFYRGEASGWIGTDFDLLVTRAIGLGELGYHEWGIEDCTKSLALNLKGGEEFSKKDAYKVRGTIYKHMKEYDKAREDYEKALELDPDFKEVSDLLASL